MTTTTTPALTAQDVWRAVSRRSFAVISHVTPAGEPRSSGVLYAVADGRMYIAVERDGWKARHIAAHGTVAVTVPIRRGGLLALLLPIPPATVSFTAVAVVHPGTFLDGMPRLAALLPPERRAECAVVEVRPTGRYVTYGLGVPLLAMRETARARARIPVG